jgi:hypothetical protein
MMPEVCRLAAISSGSYVAKETAGITLIKRDVGDAMAGIRHSQTTLRKIKQNLFWACIYNAVRIPVTALGPLNPTFAAAAMALSSLSVIVHFTEAQLQLCKRRRRFHRCPFHSHSSRGAYVAYQTAAVTHVGRTWGSARGSRVGQVGFIPLGGEVWRGVCRQGVDSVPRYRVYILDGGESREPSDHQPIGPTRTGER